MDQPVAALLKDLKQRGLLESTLIIWGGEFGRLPLSQVDPRRKNRGSDHGPGGFNTWLVGAGVKGALFTVLQTMSVIRQWKIQ